MTVLDVSGAFGVEICKFDVPPQKLGEVAVKGCSVTVLFGCDYVDLVLRARVAVTKHVIRFTGRVYHG